MSNDTDPTPDTDEFLEAWHDVTAKTTEAMEAAGTFVAKGMEMLVAFTKATAAAERTKTEHEDDEDPETGSNGSGPGEGSY